MMDRAIKGLVWHRKLRRVAAYAIAATPVNALRKLLLRWLLGYRIGKRVKIGIGVFIDVDAAQIGDNVVISRGNAFFGPVSISIGDGTFFGKKNQIMCGWSVTDKWADGRNYGRSLTVGANCLINEGHLFDIVGSISIGDGSWIAGFRSQLMTHGASVTDRDIAIGSNCFLGSAVLVTPGSTIGDQTIVAMGALIIGGAPAKVLRERRSDDAYQFAREW